MNIRKYKIVISMILVMVLVSFSLAGCGKKASATDIKATDLMQDVDKEIGEKMNDMEKGNLALTDFSVRLLKECNENGKNTLLSPMSVMYALAMTANGAQGETLSQMETVMGMNVETLNKYLFTYKNSLPEGEKYKLSIANSIWFTDDERFTVQKDFLKINGAYYDAGIYRAPFDDSTVKDINNWVSEKTDKMIPEVLKEIPENAVMYLVNALAFDAEWQKIYNKYQISEGDFTMENGEVKKAHYMHSEENIYLEDEKATGFMKYYADGKYAFVAMLPNEGISVSEYINYLDGEKLSKMLKTPYYTTVYTSLPKFETEYEVEMSEVLEKMGMPTAFDGQKADFTKLGTSTNGNIFINKVIHKTFISVDEKGTKAGAVTAIEMTDECAPADPKNVYLNRPFVYMIIDCENNIPFFIGSMMEV